MEEKNNEKLELTKDEMATVAGGAGSGKSSGQFKVQFLTIKKASLFVNTARQCSGSVTLIQGAKRADGKKLLETISLDLVGDVTVELSNPEESSLFDDFKL